LGQACLIEFLGSFLYILIFIIQSDSKTKFSSDRHLNPMFTSIAFGSCVLLAYPISGGCLNPAIGVGINIVNVIAKGEASAIQFIYVYAVIPLIGGVVAILFFEKVYKRINFEQSESILD
jgi:glycerol uptake facilitator-like aquaporin